MHWSANLLKKANLLDSVGMYSEADKLTKFALSEEMDSQGWTQDKVDLAKSMGFTLSGTGFSAINESEIAKQIYELISQDYSYDQVLEKLKYPYTPEFHAIQFEKQKNLLNAARNGGAPPPVVYYDGQKAGWDEYIAKHLESAAPSV